MKKDRSNIVKILLAIADVFSVVASMSLAYYYRVHFDGRPYYFNANTMNFAFLALTLIPIWLIVNFLSGLYSRFVFLYRPKEYGRIFVASVVSVMSMISYEFFTGDDIFPVRIIAIYFVGINFFVMVVFREIIRVLNRILVRNGIGRQKVLVIGNNEKTTEISNFLTVNIDYGYDVVGVVSKEDFLPKNKYLTHFSSFKEAILGVGFDIIIQTDLAKTDEIYNYATENHIGYMFVPQQDRLLSKLNNVEIIDGIPVIDVKITKLFGIGLMWKRLMDILLSFFGIIFFSPVMIIVAILMKIFSPKDSIFFTQTRLTRFNKPFKIYKFRSQKSEFDGLTPEQAFEKIGKPELADEYRKNGDQLNRDPRITKIGKFIRATSIDELPQLFNILKGDISIVGPRALIPEEINKFKRKNIILSVKAGLTGLAQVSGRRNISFDERRRLDVYYVQNWSLLLDIQIILKTVFSVIFRRGAK